MRKHSPRKWLHAILDLLPVILIPVFMIYSHRHTLTESPEVNIQYKYQTNEVNSTDDLVEGNVYHIDKFVFYQDYTGYNFDLCFLTCGTFNGWADNVDDFFIDNYSSDKDNYIIVSVQDTDMYLSFTNLYGYISSYFDINLSLNDALEFNDVDFTISNGLSDFKNYLINVDNDYDITLSSSDFNVIESVEVQDSNDNIMSVFAKDLSNTVDNYFNMNEVFNLGDVWTWINTNIFSGTAPLIAKTIWNIIVYEFVIDLLFVFYSFFMFLIDFVDNLLEKPFNKGR